MSAPVRSEEILVVESARGEAIVAIRGEELIVSQGGHAVAIDTEDAEEVVERVLEYVRRHVRNRKGQVDEHEL